MIIKSVIQPMTLTLQRTNGTAQWNKTSRKSATDRDWPISVRSASNIYLLRRELSDRERENAGRVEYRERQLERERLTGRAYRARTAIAHSLSLSLCRPQNTSNVRTKMLFSRAGKSRHTIFHTVFLWQRAESHTRRNFEKIFELENRRDGADACCVFC